MSTWRLGPYRALEHVFEVEGVKGEPVRARLDQALSPLAATIEASGRLPRYRVEPTVGTVRPRFRVAFEGRRIALGQGEAHAAGLILWHVNQRAVVSDRGRHLLLHAAAAELDGVLVVLLGESGVGKTTTMAGLLGSGFRYLTDEAVALDRQTLAAVPFPKTLALNADVVSLFPRANEATRADAGDPARHVAWWDLGSPGIPAGLSPGLVVALRMGGRASDAAPGESWAMTPGQAVVELAASTFRFRRRPRQNLTAAASLASSVPTMGLATGDLDASVAQISSWVSDIAAGRPLRMSQPAEPKRPSVHPHPRVPADIDGRDRYLPVGGLTATQVCGELLLRHPASGDLSRLSDTGRVIWEGLRSHPDLEALASELAVRFGAPKSVVSRDVAGFVHELLGAGLVRRDVDAQARVSTRNRAATEGEAGNSP